MMTGDQYWSPNQMEMVNHHLKNFFRLHKGDGLILLEGLEYLMAFNQFKGVLILVQSLKDHAALNQGILLIGLNPATLEQKQLKLFERDLEIL